MTRRVGFLVALASCLTVTSLHAADQVLTIYFMGTGMTSDMWQTSTSNFGRPETVATLYHFQEEGVSQTGANHLMASVTGFPSGIAPPDWEGHNDIALGYLNGTPDCEGLCITLNLVGFSRGAVSALRFAKYVKTTPSCSKCQSIKKVNVLAFDPVPGDESGEDAIIANNFNLEPGVEYLGFYVEDERSWDFSPVYPHLPNDPDHPRFDLFKVRGAHETLVGNTSVTGHGDGYDADDDGLEHVAHTLRMVATEILGSSDWGHVRFRTPAPSEASQGGLDLNWYAGRANIARLRQDFVDELEAIGAFGDAGYRNMRTFSYNFDGGTEAWWNLLGSLACHTVVWDPDDGIVNPRCAYYHPGGYGSGNLGQPNSSIDDNVQALSLNATNGDAAPEYVLWDLIAEHGSLDVDADLVDYVEDNCPETANADQTDSDSDGIGNVCDTCPASNTLAFLGPYEGQNWKASASDGGDMAITPAAGPAGTGSFHYNIYNIDLGSRSGTFRTWTFSAHARHTGPLTLDWTWSGFHAYVQAERSFRVFVDGPAGRVFTDIVPRESCSGGFILSGTNTISVNQGYRFGFELGGTNNEPTSHVTGTLSLGRDADGDLVNDTCDNCPAVANAAQEDLDGDQLGDVCDPDADGDDILDGGDNCQRMPNALQRDSDADGAGDVCDCAPQDAGVTTPLGPARNLRFVSKINLAWDPPAVGSGLTYDLVRSGSAANWQSVAYPATHGGVLLPRPGQGRVRRESRD
jgi:hypothetical protein